MRIYETCYLHSERYNHAASIFKLELSRAHTCTPRPVRFASVHAWLRHLLRDDIMRPALLMITTRPVVCMSRKHIVLSPDPPSSGWGLGMRLESTWPAVGTVDGRGYNDQQKGTFCDSRGLCQMIQSTFKPVFCWFRLIGYIYELIRLLDFKIGKFCGDSDDNRKTGYLHACTR